MVDLARIGTPVAAALAMTLEAGMTGAVGDAVKDAYDALKEKAGLYAPSEIAALETHPKSKGVQLAVAEILDQQSEAEKEALRALTEALVTKLKDNAEAIGLDVKRIEDLDAKILA